LVRQNQDGRLAASSYGRVSSFQLDPIEKKPLHFFHPRSKILSLGAAGCNLNCPFCQNWRIAHPGDQSHGQPSKLLDAITDPLDVSSLVRLAEEHRSQGNIGVAFTYNEPFIWFEYVLDAARALRSAGLKTVLVTNGYIHEEPLMELLPFVDAVNIDIKGFTDEFYRGLKGRLAPVLHTAVLAKQACHVEITNLLISGLNTTAPEVESLVEWIAGTLGDDTPLHLSRYFPARRLDLPATSTADVRRAGDIAAKRLKHVVLGNL
jgi:pyruvate formate lyase activating enzyme